MPPSARYGVACSESTLFGRREFHEHDRLRTEPDALPYVARRGQGLFIIHYPPRATRKDGSASTFSRKSLPRQRNQSRNVVSSVLPDSKNRIERFELEEAQNAVYDLRVQFRTLAGD